MNEQIEDRLPSIKSIRNYDDLTLVDIDWLIEEVERLRAARIADLESVVAYGKHLGATEHIQGGSHTVGDQVIWKAHKLAMGLRFNETGEKCPDCKGFRWAHE